MDPRERALTVRLLEKAARHPEYVKRLGLEIAPRPFPGSRARDSGGNDRECANEQAG